VASARFPRQFALLKIVGNRAADLSRLGQSPPLSLRNALVAQVSRSLALFAVGMVIAGEQVIVCCNGKQYAARNLAAWLSWRPCRANDSRRATGVAWSRGETFQPDAGTWFAGGLALVVPVIWFKGPLFWVAAAGLVGEVLALLSQTMAVSTAPGQSRSNWPRGEALPII